MLFTSGRRLDRETLACAARECGPTELTILCRILPVDSLPLLGTGKIDNFTLKQTEAA